MQVRDEGFQHLEPLVRALIVGGNKLRYSGDLFRYNQSGAYCALEYPIDFEIARSVPSRPEVKFDEELDMITCRHCWTVISGGRHETVMSKKSRRGEPHWSPIFSTGTVPGAGPGVLLPVADSPIRCRVRAAGSGRGDFSLRLGDAVGGGGGGGGVVECSSMPGPAAGPLCRLGRPACTPPAACGPRRPAFALPLRKSR
jgi:hypothetical protein